MSKKQSEAELESMQLSLFDSVMEELKGKRISSDELAEMLAELKKLHRATVAKEQAAQKAKEEREREQRLKEEKERKEAQEKAHIEEVISKASSMDLPLDWSNAFDSDKRVQGVHAESISDGLILSLTSLGCVDIEYISSVTGDDYKSVISALKGSIYQNPEAWDECFYKGWETSDEYLSGNLMRKWKAAKEANKKYKGYFSDNMRAIEKVLPDSVPTEEIYITLGSPWVPTDIIDDFIQYLFGRELYQGGNCDGEYYAVKHDELTGSWEVPAKNRYGYGSVPVTKTFGTSRMGALYILEKTLNMKTVAVYDKVICLANTSGQKSVINKAETVTAIEKQKKLIEAFQKWVWQDKRRKERLEIIYENNYSCVRRRVFDGSHLKFPDMSKEITLYPYQKNAVARILFSKNTLLSHDVGSGKTYVMIAAGMELLRMGLSKKNLYVVPNNIVGQWKNMFLAIYPPAKLFCVEPRNFTPKKREAMLEIIRDEDFDGIIMAYSCFEQIPLSKDFYIVELEKTKEAIHKLADNPKKATSKLKRKSEAIERALYELELAMDDICDTVYFDELGITRLFVDEAHNFKNVPIDTKVDKVLGISASGSKKCQDMMDKVRLIQKDNEGGGVVMATGTPITNSITDAYIMQKYLQSGELAMLDLQSFDSWIGMFAERVTEFEIDVDTSGYRLATRFAKFHNIPELTALLSSVVDFHQLDKSCGIPDIDGYSDALIGKTPEFDCYLKDISQRADCVRLGEVSRTEDNMLKITTDGRKAALDLRLVDPKANFTYQSKVARCAENVFAIYQKTYAAKGTQLIFCDSSTPKSKFNLYDELKTLLIAMGVPPEQIAYIHNADTEEKRAKLYAKVRGGELRILIGSTPKLGLGVNIQDKLIALHHLDVPWRPADMIQREGRILRQGNQNSKVYIYRYITEGSFDAYSWQLLETKQRFIAQLLSGSLARRNMQDIENTVLNYAEVKALAVGNPLIKQRVEAANELSRSITLQRNLVEARLSIKKKLMELPGQIENQKKVISSCIKDSEYYFAKKQEIKPENGSDKKQDKEAKEARAEKRRALRKIIYDAVNRNALATKEEILLDYQGFAIVLPANMTKEKPFVWLRRSGSYYVELGESKTGVLIRIDNFLDHFEAHRQKLEDGLKKLETQQKEMKAELESKESYADLIEEYKTKLAKIDQELGVEKG